MWGLKIHSNRGYIDSPDIELSLSDCVRAAHVVCLSRIMFCHNRAGFVSPRFVSLSLYLSSLFLSLPFYFFPASHSPSLSLSLSYI